MLHEFLSSEREEILELCINNLNHSGSQYLLDNELAPWLTIFYNELIDVLREDENHAREVPIDVSVNIHPTSGKESGRIGYNISEVFLGYRTLYQAITMHAIGRGERIQPREFNQLNFYLDVVIAEAVAEYKLAQNEAVSQNEILRLGSLAHELRNALDNATIAHQLLKRGIVGTNGETNQLLEDALCRAGTIIDRSLSEIRMRSEPEREGHG